MKNNKGFTVVELIVSFALTMIIAIFLFEVLIEVKDIFADASTRTAIQEKASIISKNIDTMLAANDNRITCNNSTNLGNCTINGKKFQIDKNNNKIIIDGQNFEMPATVNIKNYSIENSCDGNNCYLHINMTLDSGNLTKDYNYDVTYYFTAFPTEIPGATFTESGTYPKTITITYPDGCGDRYTCTYKKDNGQTVTVTDKTVEVVFTTNGKLEATVSDGKNSTVNSYNVEVAAPINLSLATNATSNTIKVVANATSTSPISKYEFSIDGGKTWINAGKNNTYSFTDLKQGTKYTVMTRVTNESGTVATASKEITTSKVPFAQITESGTVPKTVTITYPDGCGSTYTCTYKKDNGQTVTVTDKTVEVIFNESGSITATVNDGTNTSNITSTINVAADRLSVSINSQVTTKSITAIANIDSVSKVTKVEYSKDGGKTWNNGGTSTSYKFDNLNQNTSYTIMVRVTNATGKVATATKNIRTSSIPAPTFTESGIYPKTVTVTFPDGCGSTYTCTYQKDNGQSVTVTSKTANVQYDYHGTLVATVSDGLNKTNPTYNVVIKLRAVDLSYENDKTGLNCEDAQCALDAIKKLLES